MTIFKSELRPEWGVGIVVEEGSDHWLIEFEHGGPRKFIKSKAKGLVAISYDVKAHAALVERATNPSAKRTRATPGKAKLPKRAAARFQSLAQQVAFFEKLYPGGFEGEAFTRAERGPVGTKAGQAGSKTAAIELAQDSLSAARFEKDPEAQLFENALRLLGATNLVGPVQGSVPFAALTGAERTAAVTAMRQLLHGTGDYAQRVERFAGAVRLKHRASAKAMSWPLATVFGALMTPTERSCIKPEPFAAQAATLGVEMDAAPTLNARTYQQLHDVALLTQERLRAAGLKPRDLVDVTSFIVRTHSAKPAEMV